MLSALLKHIDYNQLKITSEDKTKSFEFEFESLNTTEQLLFINATYISINVIKGNVSKNNLSDNQYKSGIEKPDDVIPIPKSKSDNYIDKIKIVYSDEMFKTFILELKSND